MTTPELTETEATRYFALAQAANITGDFQTAAQHAWKAQPITYVESLGTYLWALNAIEEYQQVSNIIDTVIPRLRDPNMLREVLRLGRFANCNLDDYGKAYAQAYTQLQGTKSFYPDVPMWDRQDISGKKLTVIAAMDGIGDHIMMSRFLPLIKQRGADITLQAPASLHRLFSQFSCVSEITDVAAYRPGDYQIQLSLLPHCLNVTAATIPQEPYIRAEPMSVEGEGVKIGLSWGASWMNQYIDRTCALAEMHPITQVDGASFYSLQKGGFAKQLNPPPVGMRITDLSEQLHDFADTASAIAALDAVVSTDNVVANLAGAMGKPVFLLADKPTEWRWGARGRVSWYPTARIYQQATRGVWQEPINRLAENLREFVNGRFQESNRGISPELTEGIQ